MMSTRAAGMKDLNFNDVMEITNGQTWQNSSQNSVLWRGVECHCQVAEYLLRKCKKIIKF